MDVRVCIKKGVLKNAPFLFKKVLTSGDFLSINIVNLVNFYQKSRKKFKLRGVRQPARFRTLT